MIVDDLRQEEAEDGRVERSARLRWSGGSDRIRLRAPAGLVSAAGDGSAYLAAALPLAMRREEDLELDCPVSPLLLARSELIQSIYRMWNPLLHQVDVRAASADPATGGDAVGAFFSRGVDSTYTATADRHGAAPLTHLLFVDGLDLRHDEAVRAEEIRLATEASGAIGLPLVAVATNVRELSEPLCDWEDMAGAGLSFVALSLGAWLGRAVVPATDTYMDITPCGTSPLLDPLFSTEVVEIEHDRLDRHRPGKVAWIAERRPELLRYLKVCFAENRPDNCGRCDKCLLTMAALQAAGALDRATGFPDRIDPEALRAMRVGAMWFTTGYVLAETCRALPADGEGGQTRHALLGVLADRGPWVDPYDRTPVETFRIHHARTVISVARDGRPYPPLEGSVTRPRPGWSASLGLVRTIDPIVERHHYGVGAIPPGRTAEELGSLSDFPLPDSVPAWLTPEGYLVTADHRPSCARPAPLPAIKWALAPLSRRGAAPLPQRARWAASRLRLIARPRRCASPPEGEPVGYLHREDGRKRRPLYSGVHVVTGDQLLSSSPTRANEMGYEEVTLLGYVDARAPLTGRLAGEEEPVPPWVPTRGTEPVE